MYGADYRAMKIGLDAAAPLIVAAELDAVVDEIRAGSYPHLYRLASNLADRAAELRGGAS
ncbi:MAG: hypothetical protein ACRDMV_04920 [Streptosporangiales bacterium]